MSLYDQRKSFEAELVEKALKNDDFRKALMDNPKAALEKEWGVSLPSDMQVSVHQETRKHLHVVLPTAASASDELQASEIHPTSLSSWGHFAECTLECTQCGNNDTTCQPGPTGEE